MKGASKDILLRKLADRVRELREAKGLTQYQCYLDTMIHFGRIEKGERDISFTTLKKLSDFFGLTMEEFLGDHFD